MDLIKLETKEPNEMFYKKGIWYAFTYNPITLKQRYSKCDDNPRTRGKLFRKDMAELFQNFGRDDIEYYTRIEISNKHNNFSDKAPGPRLHLHGIIRFRTECSVYLFMMYHLNKFGDTGQFEIAPVHAAQTWYDYMHKQYDFFKNSQNEFTPMLCSAVNIIDKFISENKIKAKDWYEPFITKKVNNRKSRRSPPKPVGVSE